MSEPKTEILVEQGDEITMKATGSVWSVVRLTEDGFAEIKCIAGRNNGASNTVSLAYIRACVSQGIATIEHFPF